jgi:hypothetical protein
MGSYFFAPNVPACRSMTGGTKFSGSNCQWAVAFPLAQVASVHLDTHPPQRDKMPSPIQNIPDAHQSLTSMRKISPRTQSESAPPCLLASPPLPAAADRLRAGRRHRPLLPLRPLLLPPCSLARSRRRQRARYRCRLDCAVTVGEEGRRDGGAGANYKAARPTARAAGCRSVRKDGAAAASLEARTGAVAPSRRAGTEGLEAA